MAERRIGLIPYAMTIQRGEQEYCAIFVTDQRTIMVFTGPKKGFRDGLKQMYGKEADMPIQAPPAIDFRTIDIEQLAGMNNNVAVRHSSIEKFSCGKGVGGYGVWILYKDDRGKKQGMFADFVPHPERKKQLMAEGKSAKEIKREYAEKCQMVFKRALPVALGQEGDWKI